jgi:predicted GNAT superfamily acetyltransferase
MLEVALLPVSPTVEPALLALSNAHAAELSWLNSDRLTLLCRVRQPELPVVSPTLSTVRLC